MDYDYRIAVDAPTGLYYLQFKHLHGTIKAGTEPIYVSGGNEYTKEEVKDFLLHSTEPLPKSMLRGHRLATAAYVWDSDSSEYDAGVGVLSEVGEVPKDVLRRGVLSHTIDHMDRLDRAYFHLILSEMEGRDMQPILRKVLHRKRTDWVQLVHHVVATENPLLRTEGNTPTHML